MYFTPSYNGAPIFGLVTSMQHVPNATAQQIDAFFGVSGNLALFGGARGRVFLIAGTLHEFDIPTLNADEAIIMSFADGIARTLVDTRGRAWSNVIFKGEYTPDPGGPHPTGGGWCVSYHCVFQGLA
jgi:hypothetical protein